MIFRRDRRARNPISPILDSIVETHLPVKLHIGASVYKRLLKDGAIDAVRAKADIHVATSSYTHPAFYRITTQDDSFTFETGVYS